MSRLLVMGLVIRCGTPDCDWGHKVPELSHEQLKLCYSEFRKHCMQRHGLDERENDAHMHLDLKHWMLTLIKS